MKSIKNITLPLLLLLSLATSIFAAQSILTLQKKTNIRVYAGESGLAKIVTLPVGTVVTFPQEDFDDAKKMEYAPGKKTSFVGNVEIVSIPKKHNMSPDQIDELAYNLDAGIPLYMAKSSLKDAKSPGTQQQYVQTLTEGALVYSSEESFNILDKEELDTIRDEILYSGEPCISKVLPPVIGKLHFSPVAEHIYGEMVMKYSLSSEVDKMLRYAIRNKKDPGEKLGQCYKYVKMAMLNAQLVPFYLDGFSAKYAGDKLENVETRLDELKASGEVNRSAEAKNFINLMADDSPHKDLIKSPYDAPRGSILVYDGGPHGHIEIKVGNAGEGGFVSDYFADSARSGHPDNGLSNKLSGSRNRKLIAVLVRPDVE